MRDIPPDLAPYSPDKPLERLDLLFIHHSCGGQLLAGRGDVLEKRPGTCIYASHPNGGSLRSALERNNYLVHEASHGSFLGQDTDICAWRRKFRDHMNRILTCEEQDKPLPDGKKNRVVVFKSCFPNSWMVSEGKEPGDPDSAERTTANCKAAYRALLPLFSVHPGALFVAFTAPPMARPVPGARERAFGVARALLGRPDPAEAIGGRVRAFNTWLKDMDSGWLRGYGGLNVVVFDYYDILTGYGGSNWSAYPTGEGLDSHPGTEGNTRAAMAFLPFLNMAVKRAGI
jgi:hypothetical protein